ncbi:MAG: tetratricopeptide repeat protein [Thalassotalea sp.]
MVTIRHYVMSLLVLLPSSSFFWPAYIDDKLAAQNITPAQLSFALKQNYQPSFNTQLKQYQQHSIQWFNLALKLGKYDADIAFELATFYQHKNQIEQAEIWYQTASQTQHVASIVALARLYFQQQKWQKLEQVFTVFKHQQALLPLQMEVAMAQGQDEVITELNLPLKASAEHSEFYQELLAYRVFELSSEQHLEKSAQLTEQLSAQLAIQLSRQLSGELSPQLSACGNSVQFFATSLANLRRLDYLIDEFKQHALSAAFCLAKPRYINPQELACRSELDTPIQCQEHKFPQVMKTAASDYLGLMLPAGGANVYQGIVYIDNQDSSHVLAHELAHLIGFADEYPVRKGHVICQSTTGVFANNVIVLPQIMVGEREKIRAQILKKLPWGEYILETTPILSTHAKGWLLGTDLSLSGQQGQAMPIGLFSANTCNNNDVSAFKPLLQRTQLEYFETPFPAFYYQLYQGLRKIYQMPPFKVLFTAK